MELAFLKELLIIFSLSIAVIYVCHRIKVPVLVGFLITGIICGPYGLGLVQEVHVVETLSEIGIVLLLFTIGMELHLDMLVRLKKFVLIGGIAQVGLTTLVTLLAVYLVGHDPMRALFTGFLVALSSTAIVLQFFQQRAQMESPQGSICLAILVLQDLIVVPMVLITPILASGGGTFDPSVLISAALALAVITGGFFVARKVVPMILLAVVRTRSRELFNISVLAVCLAIALLTSSLGLSLSLGAFLAGILLAESEYSQSAMEGVMPFKDIFTSLFFISVGMLLNTSYAVTHLEAVLGFALLILVGKSIITTGITRALGYPWRIAIISGLALSQVGEFSFVLAKSGLDVNLIDQDYYQVFLAASVMTMVAAPFLLKAAPGLASRLALRINPYGENAPEQSQEGGEGSGKKLADHLIIVGFGICGQHLARAAGAAGIDYTILEMNPDTVRAYAASGEPIQYGDATHPAILKNLGIERARVLAVVISDPVATRNVVNMARRLNSSIYILARTHFLGEVPALKKLGASDVIPEEFETSVEMFTRVLYRYLVPQVKVERFIEEIRAENYQMLRKRSKTQSSLADINKHLSALDASALLVDAGSELIGKTLAESALRRKHGITVVAVLREGETLVNPGADFVFKEGDTAYVFASVDRLINIGWLFSGAGKQTEI